MARVKLDSLKNPKVEIWPVGAVIPSRAVRVESSPTSLTAPLSWAQPWTSPGSLAPPRLRLPPDTKLRATTRSATTNHRPALTTQPAPASTNATAPPLKSWTPADDAALARLKRDFPKATFAWLGSKLGARSAETVQARWQTISASSKTSTRASSAATTGVAPSRSTRRRSNGTTPSNLVTDLPAVTTTTINKSPVLWNENAIEKLQALFASGLSKEDVALEFPGRSGDACARKYRRVGPSKSQIALAPLPPLPPSTQPGLEESPSVGALDHTAKKNANAIAANVSATSVVAVAGSDWTQNETEILLQMREVRVPAADWDEISVALPGRPVQACRGRYGTILAARDAHSEATSSGGEMPTAPASESSVSPPMNEVAFAVPSSTENALQLILGAAAESVEQPLADLDTNQPRLKREIRPPKRLADTLLAERDKENAAVRPRKVRKTRKAEPPKKLPTVLETASVLFGIAKR